MKLVKKDISTSTNLPSDFTYKLRYSGVYGKERISIIWLSNFPGTSDIKELIKSDLNVTDELTKIVNSYNYNKSEIWNDYFDSGFSVGIFKNWWDEEA